jgi:type IV pilus assembly protein PilA
MKKNNKGFTLAELLIVVAIIAVLVAIAIPVFTTRLEASRETTDVANLRSAYAAASVAAISGDENGDPVENGTAYYYNPSSGVGLSKDPLAKGMGQGTATKGNTDTSNLPSPCHYNTDQSAQQKNILVYFKDGMVDAVYYDGNWTYSGAAGGSTTPTTSD